MALVGINLSKGHLLRYELGSGQPISRLALPGVTPGYACRIYPVGDQTYVISLNPQWSPFVAVREKRSPLILIAYPDRAILIPRPTAFPFRTLDPIFYDQSPTVPEIILIGWPDNLDQKTLLQIWSVLPEPTLLDEWVVEDDVHAARLPEWWPMKRREEIYLTTVHDQEVAGIPEERKEGEHPTVPLSAEERMRDDWYVTPSGRYGTEYKTVFLLGRVREGTAVYGHGNVPLRIIPQLQIPLLGHPYIYLETDKRYPPDLVQYLHNLQNERRSDAPIPDEFLLKRDVRDHKVIKEDNYLDCRILDVVDLNWLPQRLDPILTAAVPAALARYVLSAYLPDVTDPGMGRGPPRPPGYQTVGQQIGPLM